MAIFFASLLLLFTVLLVVLLYDSFLRFQAECANFFLVVVTLVSEDYFPMHSFDYIFCALDEVFLVVLY